MGAPTRSSMSELAEWNARRAAEWNARIAAEYERSYCAQHELGLDRLLGNTRKPKQRPTSLEGKLTRIEKIELYGGK